IYAEGQRRYLESFAAYARQFLGNMERPDVDKISGLSPVISIEQKTTNYNPRSTVGTTTELYDFFRLLYARASDAYSYVSGEQMIRMSDQDILKLIKKDFKGKKILLLSPVVKGRKGHYRELFTQIAQKGFLRVRIDGEITAIKKGLQADRYKVHDIEIVVDSLTVGNTSDIRLSESVKTALTSGKGSLMVQIEGQKTVRYFSMKLMCPTSGISYEEPQPNTFSFNSPYGACKKCNGIGTIPEIDKDSIIPDNTLSIKKGGIAPLGKYKDNWIFKQVEAIVKKHGYTLASPLKKIPNNVLDELLYGSDEELEVESSYGDDSKYSLQFEGIINFIDSQYKSSDSRALQRWARQFMRSVTCSECSGMRLKQESLYFKFDNKNIGEIATMDLEQLNQWVKGLDKKLKGNQKIFAKEILKEIKKRLDFLLDVGLDYLSLNRTSKSLSGGESQRIRLATQIGSQLVGVLYILDEPSIGLHQRDNKRLINSLAQLRDQGNSIIIVEHDKETIEAADYVLDLGPGAGIHGGKIVGQGTPKNFLKIDSLTSNYITGKQSIKYGERRKGNGKKIKIQNATGNNLKNINVEFPLGKFICVTGVSGSGKSTLIDDTLYPILNTHFYYAKKKPLSYRSIKGLEHIDKVIEIDQSPIGRTPRSNPATYTGVFSAIRNLFATLTESKIRGYPPGYFSFNVKGGRCEECQGGGMKIIEMNFLPDVYVHCEVCNGKRYNREVLDVRYRGKSINDVLEMSVEHAVDFFENIPNVQRKIKTLLDVGLGYINLGQSSTTLSGGEAQRVKLATELSKKDTGNTLYILDEPTTGLHFEDIRI
ncbi:MAG: excinuclease ABC subunit UvrA, partial [Bacteroidia bacterium]|nr:excinuclease ABC subunit UvrA [Bacteroidia bacterium]